jgi:hypothetical protein
VRTLVAGSYPPAPGPATAATLAAVRAALAAGDDVIVVSPRASAAHRRAHLAGWRGAVALARLSPRRQRLVLVAQPGMPLGDGDRAAAAAMAAVARRRYRNFDLWLVDPSKLPVQALQKLWPAAGRVFVSCEADAEEAATRLGIPASRIVVDQAGSPAASRIGVEPGGVTPFGPRDWTPREQPRRLASLAIRRVLGRRTDTLRAQVVRAVNAARRTQQATRQRLARNR